MRTIIVLAITSVLTAGAAAADPTPRLDKVVSLQRGAENRARKLATMHFNALAGGDFAALKKLWTSNAEVVSRTDEGTTVVAFRTAAKKWIEAREGMKWTIDDAGVMPDGRAWIAATVTWNGAEFYDTLILELTEGGGYRFTAKYSQAATAVGGY
jgi:hypothetical protein